jgi:hypothetical protein
MAEHSEGTEQPFNALAESVATPDELVRTALRILVLSLHRGLGSTPADLRQSAEAQRASQALYAASYFLNHEYDPARRAEELHRLGAALVPLATQHRCDPFLLHLYATGELPWRRRKTAAAEPLRRK